MGHFTAFLCFQRMQRREIKWEIHICRASDAWCTSKRQTAIISGSRWPGISSCLTAWAIEKGNIYKAGRCIIKVLLLFTLADRFFFVIVKSRAAGNGTVQIWRLLEGRRWNATWKGPSPGWAWSWPSWSIVLIDIRRKHWQARASGKNWLRGMTERLTRGKSTGSRTIIYVQSAIIFTYIFAHEG